MKIELFCEQLIVILQETQGRSLFVYDLCVSTRHSIYKWYVEVCKPYVEVCSRAKRKLVTQVSDLDKLQFVEENKMNIKARLALS